MKGARGGQQDEQGVLVSLGGHGDFIGNGGGGLGNLIIAGNNISRWKVIVLGATLPVIIALIVESGFELFERHMQNRKW